MWRRTLSLPAWRQVPGAGQLRHRRGATDQHHVTTYGTGKISDEKITELVKRHFDLRPKGIVQMLDLLRPIYQKTAAYGHFGREEPEFKWEATDRQPH